MHLFVIMILLSVFIVFFDFIHYNFFEAGCRGFADSEQEESVQQIFLKYSLYLNFSVLQLLLLLVMYPIFIIYAQKSIKGFSKALLLVFVLLLDWRKNNIQYLYECNTFELLFWRSQHLKGNDLPWGDHWVGCTNNVYAM